MFKKLIAAAAAVALSASVASAANIVQTAQSAGQFNTLLAAATAAGLVPALSGHTKLTVFAPTDAAFAKLPKGTVENLLKPENRGKLVATTVCDFGERYIQTALFDDYRYEGSDEV